MNRLKTRWTPAQYLKFADHRLRPALELMQRIPHPDPRRIVDLGCGAGQVTRMLAERWPKADVEGLDHSREMLKRARQESSRVAWGEANIAHWHPTGRYDLIFSNAALHWVPGHGELFPRLVDGLEPGGCLAVQMPLSWGAPSHRLMRETLADGGLDGGAIGSQMLREEMGRKWVEEVGFYFDLLAGEGRSMDAWTTEYVQVLEGDDPVFEWVRGAGLRPILNALQDEELAKFTREYRRRLREAYPKRSDGRTLYPFARLFLILKLG